MALLMDQCYLLLLCFLCLHPFLPMQLAEMVQHLEISSVVTA
jgi:hypothetical protein